MDDQKGFGHIAKALARNPLGIIALFIVLVYGFACLVTAASSKFTPQERLPLIWFVVIFPVLILGVFGWLVSCHSGKLFAPSDFRDEANYVRMQMSAVGSLVAANLKSEAGSAKIEQVVESVQASAAPSLAKANGWRRHILWVDDNPDNNIYERQAFEALGITFQLAFSTDEAMEAISHRKFAAIISDMGRREGPREGYVLLDKLRKSGDYTPFFFYAASNAPEHKRETRVHGGQGCTNDANELFGMVVGALIDT